MKKLSIIFGLLALALLLIPNVVSADPQYTWGPWRYVHEFEVSTEFGEFDARTNEDGEYIEDGIPYSWPSTTYTWSEDDLCYIGYFMSGKRKFKVLLRLFQWGTGWEAIWDTYESDGDDGWIPTGTTRGYIN